MGNLSWSLQLRGKIDECIFFARDCEATHWMIKSKLFLSSIQQIKKWRMVQIWYWNHKSLPLKLTNINCYMPFRNIGLVSAMKILWLKDLLCSKHHGRKTNAHNDHWPYSKNRKNKWKIQSLCREVDWNVWRIMLLTDENDEWSLSGVWFIFIVLQLNDWWQSVKPWTCFKGQESRLGDYKTSWVGCQNEVGPTSWNSSSTHMA